MDTTPALNVEKLRPTKEVELSDSSDSTLQPDAATIEAQNNATMKIAMMNAAILNMQANQRTAIGDMTENATGENDDSDSTKSNSHDFEALTGYNIEELNLLEAMSLNKSILKQLNNLKACRGMLKAVEDLVQAQGSSEINKDVMSTNYLEAYGFDDLNLEKFNELYDEYEPLLSNLQSQCTARIQSLREAGVSTQSLTDDMVYLLNKKLNGLPSGATNYEYEVNKLHRIIEAYQNRTTGMIQYFAAKIKNFSNNKKSMRELKRAVNGTASDIAGKLISHYDKTTLASFMSTATSNISSVNDKLIGGDLTDGELIALLYIMNRSFSKDQITNNHVWIDLMISNFVDIRTGIFDIMDPEEWLHQFKNEIKSGLSVIAAEGVTQSGISLSIMDFILRAYMYDEHRQDEMQKRLMNTTDNTDQEQPIPSEDSAEAATSVVETEE